MKHAQRWHSPRDAGNVAKLESMNYVYSISPPKTFLTQWRSHFDILTPARPKFIAVGSDWTETIRYVWCGWNHHRALPQYFAVRRGHDRD
jgi:hypothetical protein